MPVAKSGAVTIGSYLIERPGGPRCRACLRHPRRLRARALQADRGEPDQAGRDDPRGQRRVRRRRVCPDPRPGLRLRDLLRRGLSARATASPGAYAEKSPVIVLGGSPGLSERAQQPAACITRSRASRPSSRSSRRSPWPRPSWTGPRPPSARSTACWRRPCGTSGRSISSCRATRSTPGRSSRTARPRACRRATPTPCARRSTKPSRCCSRRAGR